jgi:hypothetical protein
VSRRLLEASKGVTYIHTYLAFGNGGGYRSGQYKESVLDSWPRSAGSCPVKCI